MRIDLQARHRRRADLPTRSWPSAARDSRRRAAMPIRASQTPWQEIQRCAGRPAGRPARSSKAPRQYPAHRADPRPAARQPLNDALETFARQLAVHRAANLLRVGVLQFGRQRRRRKILIADRTGEAIDCGRAHRRGTRSRWSRDMVRRDASRSRPRRQSESR